MNNHWIAAGPVSKSKRSTTQHNLTALPKTSKANVHTAANELELQQQVLGFHWSVGRAFLCGYIQV